MEDYKALYLFLFNGITDIVKEMEKIPDEQTEQYIMMLRQLQADAEQKFIE